MSTKIIWSHKNIFPKKNIAGAAGTTIMIPAAPAYFFIRSIFICYHRRHCRLQPSSFWPAAR